jgi:hypothetical protein
VREWASCKTRGDMRRRRPFSAGFVFEAAPRATTTRHGSALTMSVPEVDAVGWLGQEALQALHKSLDAKHDVLPDSRLPTLLARVQNVTCWMTELIRASAQMIAALGGFRPVFDAASRPSAEPYWFEACFRALIAAPQQAFPQRIERLGAEGTKTSVLMSTFVGLFRDHEAGDFAHRHRNYARDSGEEHRYDDLRDARVELILQSALVVAEQQMTRKMPYNSDQHKVPHLAGWKPLYNYLRLFTLLGFLTCFLDSLDHDEQLAVRPNPLDLEHERRREISLARAFQAVCARIDQISDLNLDRSSAFATDTLEHLYLLSKRIALPEGDVWAFAADFLVYFETPLLKGRLADARDLHRPSERQVHKQMVRMHSHILSLLHCSTK